MSIKERWKQKCKNKRKARRLTGKRRKEKDEVERERYAKIDNKERSDKRNEKRQEPVKEQRYNQHTLSWWGRKKKSDTKIQTRIGTKALTGVKNRKKRHRNRGSSSP